jgi:hypothetical protein
MYINSHMQLRLFLQTRFLDRLLWGTGYLRGRLLSFNLYTFQSRSFFYSTRFSWFSDLGVGFRLARLLGFLSPRNLAKSIVIVE